MLSKLNKSSYIWNGGNIMVVNEKQIGIRLKNPALQIMRKEQK